MWLVAAGVITGFCAEELKLFGPVHEYVAPVESAAAISKIVSPAHKGLLPEATSTGADGSARTTSAAIADVHPLKVTLI